MLHVNFNVMFEIDKLYFFFRWALPIAYGITIFVVLIAVVSFNIVHSKYFQQHQKGLKANKFHLTLSANKIRNRFTSVKL